MWLKKLASLWGGFLNKLIITGGFFAHGGFYIELSQLNMQKLHILQ